MTFTTLSFEDILHSYEKKRLKNKRLLQERKSEIYRIIPEIEAIEKKSALSYLDYARKKVMKTDGLSYDSTSSENRKLEEKKRLLLTDAGYPENYLEPIYDCPVCQDTGYVGTEKCKCFIEQMINSLYMQSNLKNILSKENFDTFSMEYYSRELVADRQFSPYDNMSKIIQKSHQFIDRFELMKSQRGNILIYGETGLGKTFLTNCIAKELLDKNHSVLYLSSNELFENILAGYFMQQKFELEDLYKYIYNCELLIIDDLGTELTNSFVQSQLFEIINKRELSGLSTLISTNLAMKQLRDKYSERIMSRIVANYTVFNIYGDNIRYQKRKNAINSIT